MNDIPPTLAGGSFNDDQSPPTVSFQFSKTIQSLSSSNLVVTNLDGGAAPSVSGYSFANNIGTFTLDSSLADAHFRATLNGVQDLLGTALAGNNALDFSFLTADANGDGVVNAADFVVVATNFGLTGNVKFSQGDFNYDGTVNALDFNALAANLRCNHVARGIVIGYRQRPIRKPAPCPASRAHRQPLQRTKDSTRRPSSPPGSGPISCSRCPTMRSGRRVCAQFTIPSTADVREATMESE